MTVIRRCKETCLWLEEMLEISSAPKIAASFLPVTLPTSHPPRYHQYLSFDGKYLKVPSAALDKVSC